MIYDIGDIIKTYLEQLPFKDKVGGIVKAITFAQGDDEGTGVVRKVMPVDCRVTHRDCIAGKYTDLIPNSKYKSVMFMEDFGTNVIEREARDFSFQSNIRLIVWLNLKKMGITNCSASALAVATILDKFPTQHINSSPYTRIKIEVESEEQKSSAIFSRYTFDEEKMQYLMYPFDYFALNLTVKYTIPKSCIPEWEELSESCDE